MVDPCALVSSSPGEVLQVEWGSSPGGRSLGGSDDVGGRWWWWTVYAQTLSSYEGGGSSVVVDAVVQVVS